MFFVEVFDLWMIMALCPAWERSYEWNGWLNSSAEPLFLLRKRIWHLSWVISLLRIRTRYGRLRSKWMKVQFLLCSKDSFQWTDIGVSVNGFLMIPYKWEGLEHREARVMAITFLGSITEGTSWMRWDKEECKRKHTQKPTVVCTTLRKHGRGAHEPDQRQSGLVEYSVDGSFARREHANKFSSTIPNCNRRHPAILTLGSAWFLGCFLY